MRYTFLLGCNPSPPEKDFPFDQEHIQQVPEDEGAFQLYDKEENIIAIKSSSRLRETPLEALQEIANAAWFDFEEDKMYSKRESELIQQYL
jgi:hypothetical protein